LDHSLTRQHKGVNRSEDSLDDSSIEPRSVEAVGFYDAKAITAGCEIKAIHIGR